MKKIKISLSKSQKRFLSRYRRQIIFGSNIVAFVTLGLVLLIFTRAAQNSTNFEAELGVNNGAVEYSDGQASGGRSVRFGKATATDLGNIMINSTLNARAAQYKDASESTVTQNLTSRGNLEPSPSGYNTANGQGQFRFFCQYSHFNYDDPIVYPVKDGVPQKGKAHLHMFWGNTAMNASITNANITQTGGGSCSGFEANRTGYWMPAVIDGNNKAVIPESILMYYKSASNLNAQTKIMPAGLKMIAGNSSGNSLSTPNNVNGIQWQCYTGSVNYTYQGQTIPDRCPPNPGTNGDNFPIQLVAIIYFPACVAVDGSNKPILDTSQDLARFPSNNHKDHLSYFVSSGGQLACPSSHPYIMPQVSYHVSWPGNLDYSSWHLSSDRMPGMPTMQDGQTLHADWYGGWNDTIMKHWTEGCINKGQNCSNGVMGTSANFPTNQQLKALPSNYSGPNPISLP